MLFVQNQLKSIRQMLGKLLESHEKSKVVTRGDDMKILRESMQVQTPAMCCTVLPTTSRRAHYIWSSCCPHQLIARMGCQARLSAQIVTTGAAAETANGRCGILILLMRHWDLFDSPIFHLTGGHQPSFHFAQADINKVQRIAKGTKAQLEKLEENNKQALRQPVGVQSLLQARIAAATHEPLSRRRGTSNLHTDCAVGNGLLAQRLCPRF